MCSAFVRSWQTDEDGNWGPIDQSTGEVVNLLGGETTREKHYERVAKKRQRQSDQLANERNAFITEQQVRSIDLQQQMTDQRTAQEAEVKALQAQQAERVGGIKAAGSAAASALRVLSMAEPTAPTAQITRRSSRSGSPRATSSSLRIGQTSRSPGSGSNLSI